MGVLSNIRQQLGIKKTHTEDDDLLKEVETIKAVMNELRNIREKIQGITDTDRLKHFLIHTNGKVFIIQRLLTQMQESTNEMKQITRLTGVVKRREARKDELELELHQFLAMQKELNEKCKPGKKKRSKRVTFSFDLDVLEFDKMSIIEETFKSFHVAQMCSP
jgi:hypothetical protein